MNQNKEVSEQLYREKYLQDEETFEEGMRRIASTLSDYPEHEEKVYDALVNQRFLPAGRIQVAVGSRRETTPYNCYVSSVIEDSLEGINKSMSEAMLTMKLGGGIGYDFSTLRPWGSPIVKLGSSSCGPVGSSISPFGFMDWFDAGCQTIRSAGHRRGAQMATMRVDHPDILHFIRAKRTPGRLTNFNVSVLVTNEFMECVANDSMFELKFDGKVYDVVKARVLWDEIMRNTWDYAEPGVIFIDEINEMNNLWYMENITATNPCGEQPLPPYGACLLGSFNLTKYVGITDVGEYFFDYDKFTHDIPHIIRAMDNVIDHATYPLKQQEYEAKNKRRMGIGITGFANTSEAIGFPYGSKESVDFLALVLTMLRDSAYLSSVELAIEKGPFPSYVAEDYAQSCFIHTLPAEIRDLIKEHGIRNSHLLSIAPTGSISLAAGNISSGIEPPYTSGLYDRAVYNGDGSKSVFKLMDWYEELSGKSGKTSDQVTLTEHLNILATATYYVDSAVSKTCNVGPDITFEEFKDVYLQAYKMKVKGITTFRPAEYGGKREGIMKKATPEQGAACFIDEQGNRTCD